MGYQMDAERAREYIIANAKTLLPRDKSGRGYICPICQDGDGSHGDNGATTKDGVHFTCWRGCFTHEDYIGIVGIRDGITDYPRKLEAACKDFGIELTPSSYRGRTSAAEDFKEEEENQNQPKTERDTQQDIHTATYTQPQQAEAEADYTAYYDLCGKRITETEYRRGLSLETLQRFRFGFDPAWKHPKAPKMKESPRLIIPTGRGSYLARYAGEGDFINYRGEVENKSKVGNIHIFNLSGALKAGKPIFIVEGEIDAASIVEVGGSALALGSIAYVNRFFTELDAYTAANGKPEQPFIIALDNEKDPEKQARVDKAAKDVAEGLSKRGFTSYRRNPCEGFKDANEALQKDRESLRAAVEKAGNIAEEEKAEYLQTSAAAHLQSFMDGIAASVNTPCISTGFFALDDKLDGGLYEGLYIMGAISSLGKTSLALQLCDNVAAAGHDVIIFSLEMARAELMAKSISRHTYTIAHEQYPAAKDAEKASRISKTSRGITDGKRYVNYSKEERELIKKAVTAYSEYAGRVFINEGVGDIGAEEIRATVEKHIHLTGRTPLILVDYLQILAPYNDRATDKQNTDKAVLELKRISRDFKTTVIAISSLNRMSYKDAIGMEAFKESGAIEYSADCLIGLQLKGAGSKSFDATAEKKKDPRTIELVILKNRNAAVGDGVTLEYYPRFNYFEEA